MPISFTVTGSFSKTDQFLAKLGRGDMYRSVDIYAQRGAAALAAATPEETGVTAASWSYTIEHSRGGCTIWWTNTHKDEAGTPIVIMLQFGHGTGTGGYVQGRDFINPAIKPVMDEIANEVWKEVTQ